MLLDGHDNNDEEDSIFKNGDAAAVFSNVKEAQLVDAICYIEGIRKTYIVYPDDPQDYIEKAIRSCLKNGGDMQVIHEWPEGDAVYHGKTCLEKKPTDFLVFKHSQVKANMRSLNDILAHAEESDNLQKRLPAMTKAVVHYHMQRENGIEHVRRILLDLFAQPRTSDLLKISGDILEDLQKCFQISIHELFDHDEFEAANSISRRRTQSAFFTKVTGDAPTAIHSLDALRRSILSQDEYAPEKIYIAYLESLPPNAPDTLLENIVVPLAGNFRNVIVKAARRTLQNMGYKEIIKGKWEK